MTEGKFGTTENVLHIFWRTKHFVLAYSKDAFSTLSNEKL